MMLHQEVPQYEGMPPYEAFILDWDTYNNNEPFWGTVHSLDLQKLAEESGFAAQRVIQTMVPSALERAQAHTKKFQGGDFGGGGGVVRLWRDQVTGALHDTQGKRQSARLFFNDPQIDTVMGIVMALAGEVSVLAGAPRYR